MNYSGNLRSQLNELLKMLRFSFRMGKNAWGQIMLSSLCGVIDVLLGLAMVWITKSVVDIATHSREGNLYHMILIIIGITLLQILCGSFSLWVDGTKPIAISNNLRKRMFSGLLESRWNEMEKFHTGDILNRITQDSGEIIKFMCGMIPFLVVTCFQLAASFLLFFHFDSTLSLTLIVVMPVFLVISKIYIQKMRKYSKAVRESESKIHSVIQESAQHRVVLKTFERIPMMVDRLTSEHQNLTDTVRKKTRISIFSNSVIALGFNGGYMLVFIWGIINLNSQAITFGTLTAFLQLVNRIQRPIYDLSKVIPSFINAWTAADRLQELDMLPMEHKSDPEHLPGKLGLKFENVEFSYRTDSKKVIQSLDFNFRPGTTNAILGETGSGKTTILRLILALIEPHSGRISVYSHERDVAISTATRNNFVYVPQGNTLFSGTIRDNLRFGNPDATQQEMEKALEMAVANFVFEMPDGIDTVLTERGGGLSEGQAQRIAIARSLLRPGNILLFDEATSALDVNTEEKLLQNLQNSYKDKTKIFITHHPALAETCDSKLII